MRVSILWSPRIWTIRMQGEKGLSLHSGACWPTSRMGVYLPLPPGHRSPAEPHSPAPIFLQLLLLIVSAGSAFSHLGSIPWLTQD